MRGPPTLTTQRLILRAHRLDDLPAFTEFLADDNATRYLLVTDEQRTPRAAKQRLESLIASYSPEQLSFSLAIADRYSNGYLGSCGLHSLEDGSGVAVYYTVMPTAQGNGIATEAVRELVDHVFQELGIEKLVAFVFPENVASVRVAEKLGFVDVGSHVQKGREGRRFELVSEQ